MYIVAIDHRLQFIPNTKKMVDDGFFGCKRLDKYNILRIANKDTRFESYGINFFEMGFDLSHLSDMIYNTEYNDYHKNRYNANNSLEGFPSSLMKLMNPVIDIIEGKDINYLKAVYKLESVIEAVYLTGTLNKFGDDIDIVDYYLIKLRYGQIDMIPENYLKILMDIYPHEVIKKI